MQTTYVYFDIAMSKYTMQNKVIETPAKINSGETFPHDSDGWYPNDQHITPGKVYL